MRIEIEIPKEFEEHFKQDKFEDTLHRLSADAHLIAGNYEQETAIMLIKAFSESKLAYDVEAKVAELRKKMETSEKKFEEYHIISALSAMRAYENAIEIIREPSPDLSQEMEEERE